MGKIKDEANKQEDTSSTTTTNVDTLPDKTDKDSNIGAGADADTRPDNTGKGSTPPITKGHHNNAERKSFASWASDERLPSWKIASIITERKITADKMLTKTEFQSVSKGK